MDAYPDGDIAKRVGSSRPGSRLFGCWGSVMAQRVSLDAMIRREDLAREAKDEPNGELVRELSISSLGPEALIRRLLRKPEFQRETNHWSPEQVAKFLKSFVDGDVIPSIILWRSTNYVFVIDGAHRLS